MVEIKLSNKKTNILHFNHINTIRIVFQILLENSND